MRKRCRRDSSFLHIPQDIIVQILAKLPAKSLMRFMAVCKLWYSTLCDPQFTEFHRRCSEDRIGGNYFATLIQHYKDRITINFRDHGRRRVPRPIELMFKDFFPPCTNENFNRVSVSPIVNGLVCLYYSGYDDHHALVFNITTREILHLPRSTTRFRGNYEYYIGYDPTTGKYIILHYGRRDFIDEQAISQVYTLGTATSSWRFTVSPPKLIWKSSAKSHCINGTMYWLALDGGEKILIAFDVSKEVFRTAKFSLPIKNLNDLFLLRGNLMASRYCSAKGSFELCQLEDADDEVKIVVEKIIKFRPKSWKVKGVRVLGVSPTEEIVVVDDQSRRRVYYYLDSKGAWRHKIFKFCHGEGNPSNQVNKICHVENIFRLRGPSHGSTLVVEGSGSGD